MDQLAAGQDPTAEPLLPQMAQLPLVLGADGVMIPLRPYQGKPHGKTQWREVKVAILARLNRRFTRTGKDIVELHQRRLVAVLGDIDSRSLRLWLEALRQGLRSARQVVWGSKEDGVFGVCTKTAFPIVPSEFWISIMPPRICGRPPLLV